VLAVVAGKVYVLVMWRRGYLMLALACTLWVLFCSPPVSAQISRRLDRCLPYPRLADEISDRRAELEILAKTVGEEGAPARARTVVLDDVGFDAPTRMPDVRERVVAELKLRTFEADSDWLEELQNVSIPGARVAQSICGSTFNPARNCNSSSFRVRSRSQLNGSQP
jgi:hypothetical protein